MKINIKGGFTLLELLLVIAIIGILSTTMVVLLNPATQLARARDNRRESDLYAILAAVYQYQAENSGELPDTDGDPDTSSFPTSLTCIGSVSPCFNLAGAGDEDTIVPTYLASMPMDPRPVNEGEGTAENTGYLIFVDANNRLVASASGETRTITQTR